MKIKLIASLILFAGTTLTSSLSLAHHSFASEFDINQPVELEGLVTRMQWSNPHAWVHMEVTTASGEKQQWMVEGGAPNALIRRGWNRDSLPAGTPIKAVGYRARDGSFRANGTDITMPDGSKLFVGSSGRGAPGSE